MGNYFICVKTISGMGCLVIRGPSSLEEIDKTTTAFKDRRDLIEEFRRNIPSLPSLDNIESIFVRKEGETISWDLGEVFYSDNSKVLNIEENKNELIEKSKNRDYLIKFLEKYVIMAQEERGMVPFEDEINLFLISVQEQDVRDFHHKFVELVEVMFKNYGIYRFIYSVNKSLEEKDKNKAVKAIVKEDTH